MSSASTDSLSTVKALENASQHILDPLCKNLSDLRKVKNCIVQWIPAHCNINGNERADKLAKEGSKKMQKEKSTSLSEEKNKIKTAYRKEWDVKHPNNIKNDPIKN